MSSNRLKLPGVSGNPNAPQKSWSDAEVAHWRAADAHVEDRSGLWIDATSDWLYRQGGAGDPPDGFQLLDRLGGRRFTPGIGARHPIVMTDTGTGKPCLLFGAGGVDTNVLVAGNNGDLENRSLLDGSGQESNRLPLLIPARGYSLAFAVRIPAPSTTLNGVAFGSAVGGVILGGSANSGSAFAAIDDTTGNLAAFDGTGGSLVATDYRNAAVTRVVMTFDPALGISNHRIWVGNESATPKVDTLSDLPVAAAKQLPRIGGTGDTVIGGALKGFVFGLTYFAAPTLNDFSARQSAFDWLAEIS